MTFITVTFMGLALALSGCSAKKKGTSSSAGGETGYDDKRTGGIGLGLLERIYFDFDRAELTSDAKDTLKANAEVIKDNPKMRVLVEGHCDERGTNEYNVALGERRARTVVDYLVANGVGRSKLEMKSWGEERPIDSGRDEAAYSRNRRGEFVILAK